MKRKTSAGSDGSKKSKPEENVRQSAIQNLQRLGWKPAQLRWKPEWTIPDTPHDLTKRERGQRYEICGSADLVAFADESGEWHALQIIFEFKAPDIEAGRSQLIRYLSNEPMAKMGYWTNGSNSLAAYKSHTNDWVWVEGAPLPHPTDDLTQPSAEPPTWKNLTYPSEAQLTGALKRVIATTVVSDSRAVRREDQLRELIHILLVKLQSDSTAKIRANIGEAVAFRTYGDKQSVVALTAHQIRDQFRQYYNKQRNRIFHPNDHEEIGLTDETIYAVVVELAPYKILGDRVDLLAKAFQIFRTAALKSGEGQYLTPLRIVRPAIMALEITSEDKVIDPACGTGAFLIEALRQVESKEFPDEQDSWNIIKWANESLYGVDKDDIGVKLTRATMIALRDGSTHAILGDSVRCNQWCHKYHRLSEELGTPKFPFVAPQFTVVVTNPPFGEKLKVSAQDCKAAGYSISKAAGMGTSDYVGLEIGLVYLEIAYRLLIKGGRVGIVLPETYFFSYSYRWLPEWLESRFQLLGVLNIPMEAFEEFCRAKTNFYIFRKIGESEK